MYLVTLVFGSFVKNAFIKQDMGIFGAFFDRSVLNIAESNRIKRSSHSELLGEGDYTPPTQENYCYCVLRPSRMFLFMRN